MKRLLILLALSNFLLGACSGTPTLNVEATEQAAIAATQTAQLTETPEPTDTLTPTQTAMPTETPEPTDTPTPTPTKIPRPTRTPTPRVLSPVRPVDPSVPLYHGYGVPVGGDPAGDGHNGYDYGFQACVDIDYDILAIEAGEIMVLGQEGLRDNIWIDHGEVQLSDGTVWRVMSTYWHSQWNDGLREGMQVARGEPILHFLSCDESGYFPEVELQMIGADPRATRGMTGRALLRFVIDNEKPNGEFDHFDPALIGLTPY